MQEDFNYIVNYLQLPRYCNHIYVKILTIGATSHLCYSLQSIYYSRNYVPFSKMVDFLDKCVNLDQYYSKEYLARFYSLYA